jgi:hypothetical protein
MEGQRVLLSRLTITPSNADNYPFTLKRRQFPVRPAFAMTINKFQGQTLSTVGVYTCLNLCSRMGSSTLLCPGLEIQMGPKCVPGVPLDTDMYTRNVVYRKVLLQDANLID